MSDLLSLADQLDGDDTLLESFLGGSAEAAMPLRLRQLADDLLSHESDRREWLRLARARAIDLLGIDGASSTATRADAEQAVQPVQPVHVLQAGAR